MAFDRALVGMRIHPLIAHRSQHLQSVTRPLVDALVDDQRGCTLPPGKAINWRWECGSGNTVKTLKETISVRLWCRRWEGES